MLTPSEPGTPPPAISAVICTVDRPDMIASAVASVLDGEHRDLELIVVDQSAGDETRRACERFAGDPRFRYVHSEVRGLSAAYNRGIAEARADLVAFTDDDCVARPDWLRAILDVFAANPRIEMLYGQTLAPADYDAGDDVIPVLAFPAPRIIGRGHELEIIGMGANFALRRGLAGRLGGFDEALGGGGPLRSSQDYDFEYRAYRAGALVRLSPEPKVDHYGRRQRGEPWERTLEAYGIGDGAFYWKHVRCGDLTALRLLVQRLAKLSLRELLNPVRRKPSNLAYLRAYFVGIRRSMRFRVDSAQRLYVQAKGAGT
ncbi:MAG: glycosyltransferase family 2 protein [Chloroflexota bacterium]|nr:glycosyltransferase family 2 protein [Chloroflexota bacterium]